MKELKIRYQVARWISRKIIGVATPEEEYCLEKWRVSDEVHRPGNMRLSGRDWQRSYGKNQR